MQNRHFGILWVSDKGSIGLRVQLVQGFKVSISSGFIRFKDSFGSRVQWVQGINWDNG